MGGRRLTSQQLQQLQQSQQQQQSDQQFQPYQHPLHPAQAMLFQHQQHTAAQQMAPPPSMGIGGLHRSAPRFHASRHRKDSLGKSVSKYMYPPGSPSMGFNENIYHPQTTTAVTMTTNNGSSLNSSLANSKHNRYPEPDPDVIEVYLEDDPIKLKEAVRDGKEVSF